jgi:hypothetical protein
MSLTKRAIITGAASILALALAACGGGGSGESAAGPQTIIKAADGAPFTIASCDVSYAVASADPDASPAASTDPSAPASANVSVGVKNSGTGTLSNVEVLFRFQDANGAALPQAGAVHANASFGIDGELKPGESGPASTTIDSISPNAAKVVCEPMYAKTSDGKTWYNPDTATFKDK